MSGKKQNLSGRGYTLASILLCLCFLGASFSFVWYMMGQMQRENLTYLENAAVQHQNTILKQINGDFQTLSGVAICLSEMNDQLPEQTYKVLDSINQNNNFIRMGLADLEGNLEFLDMNGAHYQINISEEPFFQRAVAGRNSVSKTYKDPFSDGYINYYAVAVRSNTGRVKEVLCAANRSEIFREIVDTPFLNGEGYSNIVNSQGEMMIRSANEQFPDMTNVLKLSDLNWKTEQELRDALQKRSNFSFLYQLNGVEIMAVIRPIELNDWFIFSSIPLKVLQTQYSFTAVGVMGIVLMACGIFLFLFYLQRRMSNKNQDELIHLAYDDALLGCGNFQRFLLEAPDLIAHGLESGLAIWYCDLKKFKYYNDVFGYQMGDRMLHRMAELFRADTLENGGIFCRVSADNFVGVRHYQSREGLFEWFEYLVEQLRQQENETANRLYVELCMGVYCIQPEDRNLAVNDMVNWANMAKKEAKLKPGSQFIFFTPETREQSAEESQLSAQAEQALCNGEFQLYFQPKVDIQQGDRIVGAEVLSRWIHPDRGLISPNSFIPVFEENGMIVHLDRFMLESACRWMSAYLAAGNTPVHLSINVSRLGMMREDFVEYYAQVKNIYEIPDGILELEFTESVIVNGDLLFCSIVKELKRNGFICSMDDFGSGYSSLNLLKNIPLDVLKLDILFFHHSIDPDREKIVASNVIHMAHQLCMMTVAEGVETTENVEFLRESGCNLVQGYAFFRPMPLQEFQRLLREQGNQAVIPHNI